MEENNWEYDPSEFEDTQDNSSDDAAKKSIFGYRVVIGILAVILVAISFLYFNIHRQQEADYALLSVARDSIESDLNGLIVDFDDLKVTNDSMSITILEERHRADSIISQLKRERTFNYNKLKQYEKEVGTLRTIMKGYLHTIDSLNNLNEKLIVENVNYRKKISAQELRAEMAEERAKELDNIVAQGSVLRARDISMATLNDRGNDVSRIKRADKLRVDFVISANEFAEPGNAEIYLRIISPDGFPLSTESLPTFRFDGQTLTYSASRTVDYQNQDLPVSIFYNGTGYIEGKYKIELYTNGYLLASSQLEMK
ncbi:MAG: hypothetical protein R3Y44_07585 [Rikenellaceae bacterium]